MKISRWFIIIMVVLFALLVLVEVKTPQRYNWKERTYSHYDDNPFGAKLVDSLLSTSLKSRYEVKAGDINDAYNDSDSAVSKAIILVNNFNTYNDDEAEMLFGLLNRGNTVIIFTDHKFSESLCEDLNIETLSGNYEYYDIQEIKMIADSVKFEWEGDPIFKYAEFKFRTFDSDFTYFMTSYNSYRHYDGYRNGYGESEYDYDEDESDDYNGYDYDEYDCASCPPSDEDEDYTKSKCQWTTLLTTTDYNKDNIVISSDYEKGKIVLVSYPLLFTNYYILEDGAPQLLMRILSQSENKHIVRYDSNLDKDYIAEKNKSKSPLRVFLDNKSLRWAVYLTIIAIIISLFFTARRKQRVIPVVQEPKNQTIEMIKHIGLMYYRTHDNAGLISEKYRQLVFELQRKKLIYLDDENIENDNLNNLAQLADINKDKLSLLLSRIKYIDENQDINVKDKETKKLLNFMNKILNNL